MGLGEANAYIADLTGFKVCKEFVGHEINDVGITTRTFCYFLHLCVGKRQVAAILRLGKPPLQVIPHLRSSKPTESDFKPLDFVFLGRLIDIG